MELSKRLQAVANMMDEGIIVADVGTDHGYIPIHLLESGKNPKAFAMDINEGPLLRAKEHIAAHGLTDKIEARQSDGVKALAIGECQGVIVAGMGGALAVKILMEGEAIFRNLKVFVLQPQSELEKVRQYLVENNYHIIAEDMVLEDGKYYPMMKVVNGKSMEYSLSELRYGKQLLKKQHPILKMFLEKEIKNKETILKNLEQECGAHIENRIQELKKEITCAKDALNYYV